MSRGEGSHLQCHLKQTNALFVSIGASYLNYTVGTGSRAVIASGAAQCLSGWRARPASETPSSYLPLECVLTQQVSHENSHLTPGHLLAAATSTFFLPGTVTGSWRLRHAERESSWAAPGPSINHRVPVAGELSINARLLTRRAGDENPF